MVDYTYQTSDSPLANSAPTSTPPAPKSGTPSSASPAGPEQLYTTDMGGNTGFKEDPNAFNEKDYLARNKDVADAIGKNFSSGLDHYNRYGKNEGRYGGTTVPKGNKIDPNAFNEKDYLARNKDVAAAVGKSVSSGLDHYNRYGKAEGRYGGTTVTKTPVAPTAKQEEATAAAKKSVADTAARVAAAEAQREVLSAQVTENLNDPNKFITDRNIQQTYTPQTVQEDELLKGVSVGSTTLGPAKLAESAGDIAAKDFEYEATLIGRENTAKALTELNKLEPMKAASMVEELSKLTDSLADGVIPMWAKPAVTKVEQMLASRGISASSVGRDSLFNAIITAAMPLAQQDSMYKQEAEKANYSSRVQAIFSDVGTENARINFNASTENQVKQYHSTMQSQIALSNASRKEAISQFNAGQENVFTKAQADYDNQRAIFNAQMANAVEQSNVTWRRQVNEKNTAGINAVNQANVQNAFNLSNQALSLLWQEARDEATWAQTASENAKNRAATLEATVLGNEAAAGGEIGTYIKNVTDGINLFRGVTDKID